MRTALPPPTTTTSPPPDNNTIGNKKIIFMRHGVALHNIPDPTTGRHQNLTDTSLFDAPLIRQGRDHARETGKSLRRKYHPLHGDGSSGTRTTTTTTTTTTDVVVVSSPLTRCLQTAHVAFPTMPIVCHELLREAHGMHQPDRRRRLSELQSYFPEVTFDESVTPADDLWKHDERETVRDVVGRVNKFLRWAALREESLVVVVSHGVWIEICLSEFCPGALEGGRRVYNCDVFHGDMETDGMGGFCLRNVKLWR